MTYFRQIFILVIIFWHGFSFAASSFKAACDALSSSPISVVVRALPVELNEVIRRSSAVQLTRESRGVAHEREGVTFGITEAILDVGREASLASIEGPDGTHCHKVQSVEIELAYQPLRISIASEIKEGSCTYKEVYLHELNHVAIYSESLPKVAQQVELLLQELFKTEAVNLVSDLAIARQAVDAKLEMLLPSLIKQASSWVQASHLKFDSDDLAHFNISSCNGEVRSIIRQL